jgi:hypothetical protein
MESGAGIMLTGKKVLFSSLQEIIASMIRKSIEHDFSFIKFKILFIV